MPMAMVIDLKQFWKPPEHSITLENKLGFLTQFIRLRPAGKMQTSRRNSDREATSPARAGRT
jgi:hypothetical protein